MIKPEDIDKLFRERLGNTSPTPPADLWNRLQTKMEAEKEHDSKPIAKVRSMQWVYTAVAASVSLLVAVGVVFYNLDTNPELKEQIAAANKPILVEEPVFIQQPATSTTEIENNSDNQATEAEQLASNSLEEDINIKLMEASKPAIVKPRSKKQEQPVQLAKSEYNEPINDDLTVQNSSQLTEGKTIANTAVTTNLNAEPVEIIIKRSVNAQLAMASEEQVSESGLKRKAHVAKSIFKQVRNLANGDEVELQALGIKADKIALETQIGSKKITKVINL